MPDHTNLIERQRNFVGGELGNATADALVTLVKERDDCIADRTKLRTLLDCKREDIEALQAEVTKLRADAERYRYLRNRHAGYVLTTTGPAAGCWIDCDGEDGGLCLLTGEDADAAIDAARGEK